MKTNRRDFFGKFAGIISAVATGLALKPKAESPAPEQIEYMSADCTVSYSYHYYDDEAWHHLTEEYLPQNKET